MRSGTTYNKSGKSSYAYFEIGPDLNKPYVQVVKQQVKMQQDNMNLHAKSSKFHIEHTQNGATVQHIHASLDEAGNNI